MGERTTCPSGTASSTGAAATAIVVGAAACIICGMCAIIIGAPAIFLSMRTFSSPSVISSSAMPEASTRSMSFFSFRRSMGGPVLEMTQRIFQRQFVSVCAQAGHHANGEVGEIRVVAEGFARVDIGKMNFDKRNGGSRQRVAQGDAGMGVGRRIDDDEVHAVAGGFVQALDQGTFMVVLEGFDERPGRVAQAGQGTIDVFK